MGERYSKLFLLEGHCYCAGSPVIIEAGALLKDNQSGKVIAQLKFKNISEKVIRAVTVKIFCKEIYGANIEGIDKFSYLDLNVGRDERFGEKTPIILPDASTRAFTCKCLSAMFDDGTSWVCADDANWDLLPMPCLLKDEIGVELTEQYQRDIKFDAKFKVTDYQDIWYCGCGAVNSANESICHHCHSQKSTLLAALNIELLKENKNKYDNAVAVQRAKDVEETQRLSAKRKKIAFFSIVAACAIIAFVIVLTAVIIPNSKYNSAIALMKESKYEEAISAFEALEGYKDSVAKIVECNTAILDSKYNSAIALMKERKYEEAIFAFEALEGYKDSPEKISECKTAILDGEYDAAMSLMTAHNYPSAIAAFQKLNRYKDSAEQIKECQYLLAHEIMQAGKPADALRLFMQLGNYKDSADVSISIAFAGNWNWIKPATINPYESFVIDTEKLTITYVWEGTSSSPARTETHTLAISNETTLLATGLRGSETTPVMLEFSAYGRLKVIYPDVPSKPSSNEEYLYLVRAQ